MQTKTSFVVLVIFVFSLFSSLVASPGKSFSDVSEPADNDAEDLAGVVLIISNVALGGYIGRSLADDRSSSGLGYLGIGVGLGSVAAGIAEATSFSGGVIVAGSVVTALGLMSLMSGNEEKPQSSKETYSQQGSLITPYLAGVEKGERGVGVLVRMAF